MAAVEGLIRLHRQVEGRRKTKSQVVRSIEEGGGTGGLMYSGGGDRRNQKLDEEDDEEDEVDIGVSARRVPSLFTFTEEMNGEPPPSQYQTTHHHRNTRPPTSSSPPSRCSSLSWWSEVMATTPPCFSLSCYDKTTGEEHSLFLSFMMIGDGIDGGAGAGRRWRCSRSAMELMVV